LLVPVERHPVAAPRLPVENLADPSEPVQIGRPIAADLHLEPAQPVPADPGLERHRQIAQALSITPTISAVDDAEAERDPRRDQRTAKPRFQEANAQPAGLLAYERP